MGRPKGSLSTRTRLLNVARQTKDLLQRLDKQMLQHARQKLASLIVRTLREARRLKR